MIMVAAFPQAANSSGESQNQETNPDKKPSPPDNNGSSRINQRRPRGKQVPSRYMSPSPSPSLSSSSNNTSTSSSSTTPLTTSKRYPSPLISRPSNSNSNLATPRPPSLLPKRSQSVDRKRPVTRPVTPVARPNATELSSATKMLITSTRSLSVSFQGETFSLPISKKKEAVTPISHRKSTPERRKPTPVRDQVENSRPVDQQRWPARNRLANCGSEPNSMSRSLDYGADTRKLISFGSGLLGKSLQQSIMDESRRVSLDARLSSSNGSPLLSVRDEAKQTLDNNSANELASCDLNASDTDSVSSGSTNSVQDSGSLKPRNVPRGIVVSPRFWQETNSRLRRLQDPGSPLSSSPSSRMSASSKFTQSKRFSADGPLSSPRSMASPVRGATRPASPSKLWSSSSSPSRGSSSPSRVRNAVSGNQLSDSACIPRSILSFSVDIRRGKIGEDRIVDAHMLRLLYNRYLNWRFVNARADATFMVQRRSGEKSLWNAWVTITELRHSVILKRIKLLLLRQKLKLKSILKGQMLYLEEWALIDRDHTSSLLGANEALKASTLRLPVVGNTIADIQNLKDAVHSALDVMQAMASSICSLSSKTEEMNTLVSELVNVTEKEKASLERCKNFLSTLTANQVKDCSMRTHMIQVSRRANTGSSLTTSV